MSNGKVLVVDDEPQIRRALKLALEGMAMMSAPPNMAIRR